MEFTLKLIAFISIPTIIVLLTAREINSPEYIACQRPTTEIVTNVEGVRLYKYSRYCHDNHPVYFSVIGTHTTHEESHGKSRETVDDDVPNGAAP